ncbi:MAG: DNA polymerase IV [Fastidiosipilaceae bacterium]|jgi:DNA polymerase-4|nr:DNA polymerase IV [Clostridiaceae bacterium]
MKRTILHIDMNSFYASVELIDHPEWRGRPLAVGGSQEDRHGIVLAKSEEAKKCGVKTGEALWEARQKCPDILIVPPNYEKYIYYSRRSREIYNQYTSQVESFGLDECWLDVTGSTHLLGDGIDIADRLRRHVKQDLNLTASVGVSFNKVFAKLGSDLKKPDATTVIAPDEFREIVWPLPVDMMIGIGRATRRRLQRFNIYTLGQLAACDPEFLRNLLGINGIYLWHFANGRDYAPVLEVGEALPIKSVGNGVTCRADLHNEREVQGIMQELAQEVSRRLFEYELCARGIQVTIKTNDLYTRQHQSPLPFPTQSSRRLCHVAMELFRANFSWYCQQVRALTIRAIALISARVPRQQSYLQEYRRHDHFERLDRAIYELNCRYGKHTVCYAGQTLNTKMPRIRSEVVTLPTGRL